MILYDYFKNACIFFLKSCVPLLREMIAKPERHSRGEWVKWTDLLTLVIYTKITIGKNELI